MKKFVANESQKYILLPSALVMGLLLGVFVHGGWLIDLFPVESDWLLFATLLAVLLGTAGYYALFRWMRRHWAKLQGLHQTLLAGGSILAGVLFFLAVWNCWQTPQRYISFLLPSHTFQASVLSIQEGAEVSLFQFKTAAGIVPFNEMEYTGWEARDGRLWLVDFSDNAIRWIGKTGEQVEITIESTLPGGEVILSWDGQKNRLPLLTKKYIYTRSFDVPLPASGMWIMLAGFANGLFLSLPFFIVIWKRRMELEAFFAPFLCGDAKRTEKWEWGLVLGGVIFTLVLRLPNLSMWSLIGVDEYSHINAAKWIAENGSLAVEYTRSLWTVTVPIALAFKLLGYQVWVARLVGVLFNVLAVVPLYFLARKINRPVAILSVLLFATSPWEIVFARIIREYAYYPFYFFVIVYLMTVFLEKFPAPFCLARDWKSILKPSVLLSACGLASPPLYAIFVDPYSTSRLILLAYGIFAIFLLSRLDFSDGKNLVILLGTGMGLLVAGYALRSQLSIDRLSLSFNTTPIGYFLPSPAQQWYFNRLPLLPVLGLLAAVIVSFLVRRRNYIPLFISSLWIVLLGFFVFSSNTFYAPRHLSLAQTWYIVLMALGLYLVWVLSQTLPFLKSASSKFGLILILGLATFNITHSLFSTASSRAVDSVSGDYYFDFRMLQTHMEAAVHPGSALLATTPYLRHAVWMGTPVYSNMQLIPITATEDELLALLDQNPSGWIVMDETRVTTFPFSPFAVLGKDDRVEYVGLFGDEHVWRWTQETPLP